MAPKLIESALPLDAINAAGRAEKAVPKKGLPATMHLWWSRKPTGVARALLFATLVDDPTGCATERARLLALVADLARWDCPAERIAEAGRIIRDQGPVPTVLDPFCGGGTIPLEAARLGVPAMANDLNPVATLITKALVQVPATIGPVRDMAALSDEVRRYGALLATAVERAIGAAYPPVGAAGVPVSYLWARSAACAAPECGVELPLLSTWWLSRRAERRWHVRPVVVGRRIEFAVHRGAPPDGLEDLKVGRGTNYRCWSCGEVTTATDVRRQGADGRLGLRLVAIQTFADPAHRRGRAWVPATDDQERAALRAWPLGLPFPLADVELPDVAGNVAGYGITHLADVLTPRQRLLLVTLTDALEHLRPTIEAGSRAVGLSADPAPLRDGGRGARAYADAITTYLALAISRLANRASTMTVHNRANGSVEQSFVQPAFAFYGDFPEANPFSGSTGSWANALEHVARAVAAVPVGPPSTVSCASALDTLSGVQGVVCTDPPFYDLFDYAALSTLFSPWLRRALGDVWPTETHPAAAPDGEQIVCSPARWGGDRAAAHDAYVAQLRNACKAMRAAQRPDHPLIIFWGHQQSLRRTAPAWEALLAALLDSGLRVVRTWPLRTERPDGVKSGTRALASSVLLVCRPRPDSAPMATGDELRAALADRLASVPAALASASLGPVDLAQAAVGAGLEIVTAYAGVTDEDGSPLPTPAILRLITTSLP